MTKHLEHPDENALKAAFSALASRNGEKLTPFRWQMRLLQLLLRGDIPSSVDLPTGLGKTSIMALWLIALAHGANLPRRLVYIVDRRAVVDQASRFAEQLRENLPPDLAANLGLKKGGELLPISTLRGGLTDNRGWLEDPAKPAIIVGTIDMIGSRLLFEGYGVSRRMRPYHAGLLAIDVLYVLDEAHLCPPFEALLRQVEQNCQHELGGQSDNTPHSPPFRLMSLSATGRNTNPVGGSTFRLDEEERHEPLVRQRMWATKRMQIEEIDDPKSLVPRMVEQAIELGARDTPNRVLVYCNSRKTAVEVKGRIDKLCRQMRKEGALTTEHYSELLVGERRVYERKELECWLEAHGLLGGSSTRPKVPMFLIATSAGEVGIDLDADHLICDLVAYERVVQRLGRVNRRGGEGRQAAVHMIAAPPSTPKASDSDEVLATLRQRLAALRTLPRDVDGYLDASSSAISDSKVNPENASAIELATTPAPLYPRLTRPLMDAWSMTSLDTHEGRPEVAPWLRGWEDDEEPQTTVIWRKHLPHTRRGDQVDLSGSLATQFFRAAPVHGTEKLEAPSSRVFDWLLKRANNAQLSSRDHACFMPPHEIAAIVLNHAAEHEAHLKLSQLRRLSVSAKSLSNREKREKELWKTRKLPGSLLIVDARLGGLTDGMLDEKSKIAPSPSADADERWWSLREDTTSMRTRPTIGFRVEELTKDSDGEGLSHPVDEKEWRHAQTFETAYSAAGDVLGGLAILKHIEHETDEESRSIASATQTLADHAMQAAECARDIATRLNLPKDEGNAIAIAAEMHDDGKAATRWQDAMNAPKGGRPYAKTKGGGNWRLLEGYRHEFGSLLKAEKKHLPDDMRDLILHLIASHHGYARPIIRSDGCEDGPPSLMESKAGEAALRFARLQKRYGPWGLAWREAILRAADQMASREFSRDQERRDNG